MIWFGLYGLGVGYLLRRFGKTKEFADIENPARTICLVLAALGWPIFVVLASLRERKAKD